MVGRLDNVLTGLPFLREGYELAEKVGFLSGSSMNQRVADDAMSHDMSLVQVFAAAIAEGRQRVLLARPSVHARDKQRS